MSTRKLHKKAGIIAGLFLFILSLTGFFLNHDQWNFQYQWTVPNSVLPDSVAKAEKKLFQVKTTRPGQSDWLIVAGMRGVYLSVDAGLNYRQTSEQQIYALRWSGNQLFAATEDGITVSKDYGLSWQNFALEGNWVNALALDGNKILASIDKSQLVVLDLQGNTLKQGSVNLQMAEKPESITLSRFVRDFHYGRGLLDDGWSLWLNDIATWILLFSIFSGSWIWFKLRKAKQSRQMDHNQKHLLKKVTKVHSHGLVLLALPFLVLFIITGIVLDHSKFFNQPLKNMTWSMETLPPVYQTLRSDIWSVDIEDNNKETTYRIGNRYGVYQSRDLQSWQLASKGFAYRMNRLEDTLYVSGMGAPSRTYNEEQDWQKFKAPHMFKNPYMLQDQVKTFGGHGKQADHTVPVLTSSSFYSIMLTLHDGTFFAEWWIWVNDFASVLLLIILITGVMRWQKKPGLLKKRLKV